ncbi:hypothetical protein RFI_39999, partial [Reticulomyxa filosa]
MVTSDRKPLSIDETPLLRKCAQLQKVRAYHFRKSIQLQYIKENKMQCFEVDSIFLFVHMAFLIKKKKLTLFFSYEKDNCWILLNCISIGDVKCNGGMQDNNSKKYNDGNERDQKYAKEIKTL